MEQRYIPLATFCRDCMIRIHVGHIRVATPETLFEFPNRGEVTQLINNTRQRGKPLQER